jgi:hypothetical protein
MHTLIVFMDRLTVCSVFVRLMRYGSLTPFDPKSPFQIQYLTSPSSIHDVH